MPKKIDLEIRNQTATHAELILYGNVGDYYDGVSAKQFSDQLQALGPKIKTIDLRINSAGGDVFQGYTIAQRLKSHQAKVTTYVDGMAASIASVIALAGDEIVMGENAQIMIHNSWSFAMGNASELELVANRLLDIDEQLATVYTKKTGLSRAEVKKYMDEETWFDAETSVELGFAHRIDGEGLAIAASALKEAKWLHKIPKNLKTDQLQAQQQIKKLKTQVEGFLARKK